MSYAVVRITDLYFGNGVGDTHIEWLCKSDGWHLSEDKKHRVCFDSPIQADESITKFSHEFSGADSLVVVPVANHPLSMSAIESAKWLAAQLTRLTVVSQQQVAELTSINSFVEDAYHFNTEEIIIANVSMR